VLCTGLTLRHVTPFRVLYSNLAVAAREPVESKAAKRKNSFCVGCLKAPATLTFVNLLIPLARWLNI
jgi:hypothetical protein